MSLRIESELNLKEEIQHRFKKITPSWNMSKQNTKCIQSVLSHRLESSHNSQKMCNFQPHEPSSRQENETRLQFVSVSATRNRVLTIEALAYASYSIERCWDLTTVIKVVPWILNMMKFRLNTWFPANQGSRNPEMVLAVLWSSSTVLPQFYRRREELPHSIAAWLW